MVTIAATDAELRLSHRLRQLRRETGSGRVTQAQVADALGVSPQQISNWESPRSPQVPSPDRLDEYARLFATARSWAGAPSRLLPAEQLTGEERRRYEELLAQLRTLRSAAVAEEAPPGPSGRAAGEGFLRFPDRRPIVIIGSRQPAQVIRGVPEADENHPDHVHVLQHADADAILELYGQLRAENPDSEVRYLLPDEVDNRRDLFGHVFVIGGGSVNAYAEWFATEARVRVEAEIPEDWPVALDPAAWGERRFRVPADHLPAQVRPDDLVTDAQGHRYAHFGAELRGTVEVPRRGGPSQDGQAEHETVPALYRDVALIARQPNPLQREATATLLHGLFSRGTYGAVRAFADPQLRQANEAYLASRFAGVKRFWMLVNVFCDRRLPLTSTPDLSRPESRILEWSG